MYLVGIIVKPQGIKGEVKVKPISPDPNRFHDLDHIYIRLQKLKTYSVENVRISNGFVFLKLVGVNSRNEAEMLRTKEILIPEDQLISLNDDEYFVHDLIGCKVLSEDGTVIGEVDEIIQESSNDIYLVKGREGHEYLIPAISDVIKEVNIKSKEITIQILDGLLG